MFAVNGAGRPNQIQAAQIKRHSISINLPPQPPCKLQVYFLFSNQRVVTRTNIKRMIKAVFGIQFYFGRRKKSPFMWRLRMWGSLPPFLSADENFGVDLLPLVANNTKQNETKKNKTLEEQFCWIAKFFYFHRFLFISIYFSCALSKHIRPTEKTEHVPNNF